MLIARRFYSDYGVGARGRPARVYVYTCELIRITLVRILALM